MRAAMSPDSPRMVAEQSRASSGERSAVVDFLGIGVQKAGTTWIHRMLGSHPEVFLAQGEDKDLRFFSSFYDFGYQWYEDYFQDSGVAKKRGEFSTTYFYCGDAPERVHRYNRDMRLILSLRNPVDRVISNHRHEIRIGHLTGDPSLERGIENNPSYVGQSLYFTQLSKWLEYFPLENIHVVVFEELFSNPVDSIQRIFEFLDLSTDFLPPGMEEKVNEGRIPRSRVLDRGVKLSAMGLRRLGLGWLVDGLKRVGLKRAVSGGNTRSDTAMEIAPATRERLHGMFREENTKLASLLDRDLSVWEP